MKITVKLFATLTDYLPESARSRREVDMEVADSKTIQDVIDEMRLPPKLCHLVLINGSFIPPSERAKPVFRDGDVLAIWPPVAGG